VLINLATGMEDAERVLVAFLVATAALTRDTTVFSYEEPPLESSAVLSRRSRTCW
jgi:hypothetical protein